MFCSLILISHLLLKVFTLSLRKAFYNSHIINGQMKTTTLLIGCILVISCFFGDVAAQSPASNPTIEGTLHNTTTVLFSGKTSITATFTGCQMSSLFNTSITEGMNAFILLGGNTLPSLSTVIVAEDIDITQASTLEELYQQYADHITQYTNVKIVTDTGLFLLEYPADGTIDIRSNAAYAVSSSLSLMLDQTAIPFFLVATQTSLAFDFSGDFAVLAQPYTNATITVQDQHGKNLWSGHSTNNYLIIQDQHFQITQQPPLYLFPLNPKDSLAPPLSFSVTPAEPSSINLPDLLDSVSAQAAHFTTINISRALKSIQESNTIISSAGLIANGAMIVANTNDSIMIDRSLQSFKEFGFVRFHDLTVTYPQVNSGPAIQGTYSLVFLGDHFYNPQAKSTANGIVFPYGLLIVWIIALAVFVYIRFFLRPEVDEQRDKTIKWYAVGIHIGLLILAFLLLDWEVSSQFGASALTSLTSQGVSMITGLFFGLELLIWALGYALVAIPLRLLVNSVLRVLHIGKGGRGIGAGLGDFSIWMFAAFYLLLFINIIISTFHLSNLFATG